MPTLGPVSECRRAIDRTEKRDETMQLKQAKPKRGIPEDELAAGMFYPRPSSSEGLGTRAQSYLAQQEHTNGVNGFRYFWVADRSGWSVCPGVGVPIGAFRKY